MGNATKRQAFVLLKITRKGVQFNYESSRIGETFFYSYNNYNHTTDDLENKRIYYRNKLGYSTRYRPLFGDILPILPLHQETGIKMALPVLSGWIWYVIKLILYICVCVSLAYWWFLRLDQTKPYDKVYKVFVFLSSRLCCFGI